MGYFDALTRGSFRTAKDGRWLFFPWGRFGRGYILPSEQDYERLRQQIGIYLIISIMLAVGLANLPLKIALPIYAALMVFYPAWMLRLLPRLEPSDEKWSPQESLIDRAWARSPATLWLAGIGALAFVLGSFAIIAINPEDWRLALASMAFFGLCAAVFAFMLGVRAATTDTERR